MVNFQNWSTSFATYFNTLGSKEGLSRRLGILTGWGDLYRVDRRRLMNTEFGVSHITSRGSAGAPAASAAAFVADVRQLSEQVGLGCITLHEMQGS